MLSIYIYFARNSSATARTTPHQSVTALPSTTGDGALSAPPRTKKHQSRTKSKRKLRRKSGKSASVGTTATGKPLTESDVGHHVAERYISGPGSVLRDKKSRRDRMETQNTIVQEDASHKEQMQYLRMLDRHPALVLNADYQVSAVILLPCKPLLHLLTIFQCVSYHVPILFSFIYSQFQFAKFSP